jgi:2,4-dienoyl-CoA reductase-like NADH-dependent reductase (Old Yellow Enzyme family)/thioredoxin reductase
LSSYTHIFRPLKIGKITVKNRIEFPPVGTLYGSNLPVTREHYEWGKQIARGGAAIVTIGDTAVTSMFPSALTLASDMVVNPLSIFAETVHRYGAKASIELNFHSQMSPNEITTAEINNLVQSYTSAAYRCLKAGMDMVMIHGAHGQLISQFVSPRKNHRNDIYGGKLENRARFVTEILESIRNKVGDKLAIEYRISAEEFIPDGLKVEEQIQFAKLIQDKIDIIHISAGFLFGDQALPRMIQPIYLPRGVNVDFAAVFKKELAIPVTTVGSINLDMAEQILAENKADMVAMGRAIVADPDCLNKARKGQAETIRPCTRCTICIDRTHTFHLPIRCAVNPVIGREAEFVNHPPAAAKKKVVVVGGGPAGMEAARRAVERGHEVVLFEKQSSLGGTLATAVAIPFKADVKNYLEWAVRSTKDMPGLRIALSTEATPEIIRAEQPDVLIVAIGGEPIIPHIPGINKPNVSLAGDVESNKVTVGDRVVVAGAGLTGSEAALYLAQQGKKISLIDRLTLEEIDANAPLISIVALRALLEELGVDTRSEVILTSVSDSGVVITDRNGNNIEIPCDNVILALGLEPRSEIIDKFSGLAPEVIAIGDCNNQRGNIYKAVSEGFFAAMDS